MRVAVPLTQLSDGQIIRLTDAGTFTRGREYQAQGMVIDLRESSNGGLVGEVEGTAARPYRTVVAPAPRGFVSTCTCPIQAMCKHGVATLLHARASTCHHIGDSAHEGDRHRAVAPHPDAPGTSRADTPTAAPQAADWERLMDQVLPPDTGPAANARPLALAIRAVENRYGGPTAVHLRPMVQSVRKKNPGWVKSGASWRELEYSGGYSYGQRLNTEQLGAVIAIGRAARTTGGYYHGSPDEVNLVELGPVWLQLLQAAQAAGVLLLDPRPGSGPVRLCPEPGRLVARVEPPAGHAPASLTVDLRLPVDSKAPWTPLADSSHNTTGWACIEPTRLTLVTARHPLPRTELDLLILRDVQIPAQDWGRFAFMRLPALRRVVELEHAEDLDLPTPTPRLYLRVTHHRSHRTQVAQSLGYHVPGMAAPLLTPFAPDGAPFRDQVAETALLQRVRNLLPIDALWQGGADTQPAPADQLALLPDLPHAPPSPGLPRSEAELSGMAVAHLVGHLANLPDNDDIILTVSGEPAEYSEAAEPPTISITTSDPSGDSPDWFDLSVTVTVAEEQVPLASLIAALARGESTMLLDTGTWFNLDLPELRQLASVLAEARMLQDKPSETLRITPLHAGLWEELVSIGVIARQSTEWQERVAALTDASLDASIAEPAGARATLRPYQLDGFRWLSRLWDARLGGILADDMGLGKTVQVLTALQRAHERGELADPVLIVCPTSVMSNWARETARFCPDLGVTVLDQTRRKAGMDMAAAVAGAHVVVTSYTLLRIDEAELGSRTWSALVLDEAQFVKNHAAKGYGAARRLRAGRTFVLTGTPLENSLMDLWSLLSLAAPGLYPRPDRFKEHYAVPIEREGSAESLATLRRRIRPLMLRRTKDAVAAELPPKQETVLSVPLAPKHRTIYDKYLHRERQRILGLVQDLNGNRIAVLRALTMLRQLSLDPGLVDERYLGVAAPAKVDLLTEHLRELAGEGHRALVFSQFTGFLRVVRNRLEAEGIEYCYLDGRTRRRDQVVQSFRDGDASAFLISLKAGGFGLTLTEADYVFVLDPWWNPATELQAIDRTHRIGQTKPVNVYRLVSAQTIEEKVVALQERKRQLFANVIDDAGMLASGALTADDIRALLS